ncbi:MAG: hypothetical protein QOJ35_2019, partial [Solirubrobacteraceae bacterium]|nr:hypothetical protein [Solirubrobacteraceae bacterium]
MTEIPIAVRGDIEQRAIDQLRRCAEAGDALAGVICADGHVGYSQPIGGAVAYPDHISPSGVGYDVACGNKAARTDLRIDDVHGDLPRIMDAIFERVSFGIGRNNAEPVDHPVLDEIRHAEFRPQRQLVQMASNQLGTVGAGNHYVDLFAGDDGFVWIGVHFGSRGLGHKSATKYLKAAGGRDGMDVPPAVVEDDSELGTRYLAAMHLAGRYAYAGREWVVETIRRMLAAKVTDRVHNH